VIIVPMLSDNWPDVARIYAEGIATGTATFETSVPEWAEWDAGHLAAPRLVAIEDGVVGWGALSLVSDRCVYGGVAEASVYVAAEARRRGLGRSLLTELVAQSEQAGIWTIQAGVLTDNTASRALLAGCGFREVGIREQLGKLDGIWRDVVLVERRSTVTGV
jgi:L-amino acid N-acyltransferase YncA